MTRQSGFFEEGWMSGSAPIKSGTGVRA